jgi:hypothetical protein
MSTKGQGWRFTWIKAVVCDPLWPQSGGTLFIGPHVYVGQCMSKNFSRCCEPTFAALMITLRDGTVRSNRILKQKIGTIRDIILKSFSILTTDFKCQNVSVWRYELKCENVKTLKLLNAKPRPSSLLYRYFGISSYSRLSLGKKTTGEVSNTKWYQK